MAFSHQILTDDELGPAVLRLIGPQAPPPMRAMVAQGMVPLPPRDLVVGLYQLWCGAPELAEKAGKSIETLPPPVISGALDDPRLPAGVLDLLGRKLVRKEDLLDRLVRHPNVHDETLAGIARVCPERVCETLAENQQRWLTFPAIVANLYQNPNCRMSVVQRMLELALREGVDVRLPNMEEIKNALAEDGSADPTRDAAFRDMAKNLAAEQHAREIATVEQAAATDEIEHDRPFVVGDEPAAAVALEEMVDEAQAEDLPLEAADLDPDGDALPPGMEGRVHAISQLKTMEKIRLALLGGHFERAVLIRDSNKVVALSAIKSPRVKENEVVVYSANRSLSHDVIRYISNRRDWAKLYAVKFNLVMNPKTPMSSAMGFLAHLHAHDVRKVARSKNISSALATAAKRRGDVRR